jgi:hypothetical protein
MAYMATSAAITGALIRDLMALTVEQRFLGAAAVPRPIEWLSDNGAPYTANETRAFGASVGLLVRTTPAYSPESNGMAESLVKTLRRDYVYLGHLDDAETVMRLLPSWLEDYNEVHPHRGLKMQSPREYRRSNSTGDSGTPYATRPCQRGAESVVVRRLKVTGRCVHRALPLPRAAPLCQMQLAAGRVGTLSYVWCPGIQQKPSIRPQTQHRFDRRPACDGIARQLCGGQGSRRLHRCHLRASRKRYPAGSAPFRRTLPAGRAVAASTVAPRTANKITFLMPLTMAERARLGQHKHSDSGRRRWVSSPRSRGW